MYFVRVRFGRPDSLVFAEGILKGKLGDNILVKFRTNNPGFAQTGLPQNNPYNPFSYLEISKKPFSKGQLEEYQQSKHYKGTKKVKKDLQEPVGTYRGKFESVAPQYVKVSQYTLKEYDEYFKQFFNSNKKDVNVLKTVQTTMVHWDDDYYNCSLVFKIY